MYDCVYIEHHDVEKTCNQLLQYLKHNHDVVSDIVVVSDHTLPEDEQLLKCIYPLSIVTSKQFKQLQLKYNRMLNITDHITNSTDCRVGLFYYVYYTEFFTEGLNYINRMKQQFTTPVDLYIYTHGHAELQYIKDKCSQQLAPDVNVYFDMTENRGRDVRPFLQFIQSEQWKKNQYICKLHTKKTTYLDLNWRSNYFKDLLLDHAMSHLSPLDCTTSKILSGKYMVQEKYNRRNHNYKSMNWLINKLYINMLNNQKFKFNAGTMFWCNREFCSQLSSMIDDEIVNHFEPEPIQSDGTMAHAWERTFSLI